MFNGDQNDQKLNLQHPDLPTIAHAVLVVMVGIGVLFFMGGMLTNLQNILLTRVVFLLVPIWACYMFQFDVRRTLFTRWPGWRSMAGVVLGTTSMFVFLLILESILWNISELRPSAEALNKFAKQMEVIFDLEPWKVILLICVATPISEEILFRGFFLRAVRESLNAKAAIVLVGIFFGIVHFKWIPLSLFGIYLGCVVWMSRSIVAPILIHAFHNTVVLITSGFSAGSMKPDSFAHHLDLSYKVAIVAGSLLLVYCSLHLFRQDRNQRNHRDQSDQDLYNLMS
jgi:membrane protease YdiL (CAAX protease family)